MKKFFVLFSTLLIGGALLFSCTRKTLTEPTAETLLQEKLQSSVDLMMTKYKAKYPGYPGGLALKVISKKGSYFVSSGMEAGTTDQIHFRAASNTKAFTATAILLLAQEGKLNVDAKIIDTIPGTKMTYVPLNLQYNIPYRN